MTKPIPHIDKADEPLREALREAKPNIHLRAVLFFGPDEPDAELSARAKSIRPEEFASRGSWRSHLIELQENAFADRYGETLRKLREFGLDVQGGRFLRAVSVEGTPRQILASLAFDDVHEAKFDSTEELKPDRPSKG